MQHFPVLIDEVVDCFSECNLIFFLDGTLGLGGHAKALLKSHPEIERYIGLDKDSDAIEIANENLKNYLEKVKIHQSNFDVLEEILKKEKIEKVDGFLFDIGFSSLQVDSGERGFSFNKTGPLDMRMNKNQSLTAKYVINTFSEKELSDIFFEYGEEKKSKKIAKQIVIDRKIKKIETTTDLEQSISKVKKREGKIHPATLVFQALRIYVNDEFENLKKGLKSAVSCLNEGGKIAVISFHGLEDKIVKDFFKDLTKQKKINKYKEKKSLVKFKLVTKKPIVPTFSEIKKNKRSRSAKMRIIERIKVNE